MITYIIKRILSSIPTLLILVTLVFFLLRMAPGGPFDGDRAFPPEVMASIQKHYGLDQPVWKQYLIWIQGIVSGDFGESFHYTGKPVSELVVESIGPSMILGLCALFFSVLFGVPLGVLSAWRQGTWLDSSAMFLAVAGVSLPSYLVASILVLIFALGLGWLPPALWEDPSSAVLPILTLGLRPMAIVARLVRSSVLDILSSDYIRTAHAKGLSHFTVLFKHALRNALIPLLTILGPLFASLVTGSFLVEMVFQIPGLGKYFVSAVLNRDYPMVMAVTVTYGFFLIFSNLLSDLACAWADPRIRLDEEGEGT